MSACSEKRSFVEIHGEDVEIDGKRGDLEVQRTDGRMDEWTDGGTDG